MLKGELVPDIAVRLYERLIRPRILNRAHKIIATSHFVESGTLRKVRESPTIITPGVDPELFTPASSMSRNAVLFVGGLNRADRHKGLDTLLIAMKEVMDRHLTVHLEVVGNGDLMAFYKNQVRNLGISDIVSFSGRLSGTELVHAYQRSSLLTVPSRNDNFPTVVLEAMASGLPVVASAIGGIPSLVDDNKTGYLLKDDNPSSLARAIERVVRDPELSRSMAKLARRRIFELGATEVHLAVETDRCFRSLLNESIPGNRASRKVNVSSTAGESDDWPRSKVASESDAMKICVVAPYFAPRRGGVESYSINVAERLRRDFGNEVFVVSTRRALTGTRLQDNLGYKTYYLPSQLRLSNTPIGYRWVSALRRIFESERPDVIWAHTPVPFLSDCAERARVNIPFVLTYHNDIEKTSMVSSIGTELYYLVLGNRTLSRSQRIIAMSSYYADQSRRLAAVRRKVSVATCGVDACVLSPNPVRPTVSGDCT